MANTSAEYKRQSHFIGRTPAFCPSHRRVERSKRVYLTICIVFLCACERECGGIFAIGMKSGRRLFACRVFACRVFACRLCCFSKKLCKEVTQECTNAYEMCGSVLSAPLWRMQRTMAIHRGPANWIHSWRFRWKHARLHSGCVPGCNTVLHHLITVQWITTVKINRKCTQTFETWTRYSIWTCRDCLLNSFSFLCQAT